MTNANPPLSPLIPPAGEPRAVPTPPSPPSLPSPPLSWVPRGLASPALPIHPMYAGHARAATLPDLDATFPPGRMFSSVVAAATYSAAATAPPPPSSRMLTARVRTLSSPAFDKLPAPRRVVGFDPATPPANPTSPPQQLATPLSAPPSPTKDSAPPAQAPSTAAATNSTTTRRASTGSARRSPDERNFLMSQMTFGGAKW